MPSIAPFPVKDQTQSENNRQIFNEFSRHVGQIVTITSAVAAGTEFSVSHTLGYKPLYVEVLVAEGQTDAYLAVKPSGTAWTTRLVYLKCNTDAPTVTLRIS